MTVDEARTVVSANVEGLIARLGLTEWSLEIAYTRLPENTWGRCNVNAPYCQATIELDNDQIDDADELVKTLRHELVHVLCWPMHAFGTHAHELTDGQSTDSAWTFWLERMVWNVERLLDRGGQDDSESDAG